VAGPSHPLDPRLPVIVGLGHTDLAAPVPDLMTIAVRDAASDSGAPGLLGSLQCVVVPQGSWNLSDPARSVARELGAPAARTVRCEIGVSQQEVINNALTAVAAGTHDVVAVVGAEARAWERDGGVVQDDEAQRPDEVLTRPPDFVAPIEVAAGIVWPPVQQYAMIENALGASERQEGRAQRDDIAALWARFNAVAVANPDAAFGEARDAQSIATAGPRNRPLAFPYNKWHASQWTVNQASALLVCSAARATEAGVAPDRWLFPHVALHCSDAVTLTARAHLARWPAMGVLGRAARDHLGRDLAELGLVELYSCFPAAVRVQQRELGLDPAGTPTVIGGMSFAGGPFNHYVLMSLVALGRRLRAAPGELGLVTTVSGMLSKPGLAVWSATPPPGAPLVGDLADEAARATAVVPVTPLPPATPTPAVIASYTVTYGGADGLDPERTVVVADLPDGVRTAATCEDADTARLAVAEGLIGRPVEVKDTTFRL
jgi:acetyl-CoA C-acetyltransferase